MRDLATRAFAAALLAGLAFTSNASAADGAIILDTAGYWRSHYTLSLPLIVKDGSVQKMPITIRGYTPTWTTFDSALPPADWMKPEFDDSRWLRQAGTLIASENAFSKSSKNTDSKAPYAALTCLRSRFEVKSPSSARGLKLFVEYRGGVVVYLNGEEIGRGHVPKGKMDVPAESTKDGETGPRKLEVALPVKLLRKGANVLALEGHRAPLTPSEYVINTSKWPRGVIIKRAACGIEKIRLVATGGAASAVVPNIGRPKGLQVWNSNPLAADFDVDYGDRTEPLRPVQLVGTRNGGFAGKVVVGSHAEIKGLKATITDLAGSKGKVPASDITIRYARPLGTEAAAEMRYLAFPARFGSLHDVPPATVPVYQKKPGRKSAKSEGVGFTAGAVVPVWICVDVPADTPAGEYVGRLTVKASGSKDVTVPVELRVHGWKLPDPGDYTTWVDIVHSPENMALGYGVELWSEEHWALMEKSIALSSRLGNKTAYLHLICETNMGNAQSMIRWIKQPGGGWKHDFTIVDRYLDIIAKHQKPKAVIFYIWDSFLGRALSGRLDQKWEGGSQKKALAAVAGKGPQVTVLDPKTGALTDVFLPEYKDPKSLDIWKPVVGGIMSRLEKRGLKDAAMLGLMCDYAPSEPDAKVLNQLWPGVPWASQAHMWPKEQFGLKAGYKANVFAQNYNYFRDPSVKRVQGWKAPDIRTHFWRRLRNHWPITAFRLLPESCISRHYRGFARMGGDFFPTLKDKRGRIKGSISARYEKGYWNNLNIVVNVIEKGTTGPVPTARLEMLREGVQECEARIYVERALVEPALRSRLGEKLAAECQDILDRRTRDLRRGFGSFTQSGHYTQWNIRRDDWWKTPAPTGAAYYVGSDWQKRSDELYGAATMVAVALGQLSSAKARMAPRPSGDAASAPAKRPAARARAKRPAFRRTQAASQTPEAKAARLWRSASNFINNNAIALGRKKLSEIVAKHPETKYAEMARSKLAELEGDD